MWDKYLPEQLTALTNAMNPIACATPNIAVFVNAETVRESGLNLIKDVSSPEGYAIGLDLEYPDILLRVINVWGACLCDINETFIWGESQAIRPIEVPRHDTDLAAVRLKSINCGRLLRLLPSALIIIHNSKNRVGEPDGAVRFYDDIVWRV
jgi:hypothetical protein